MSLSQDQKTEIIKANAKSPHDTGSTEVQVALITARLESLQNHFQSHGKDYHSRRGLMKLVGQRRRMLDYLKRRDIQRYRDLIQRLGIRK